MGTLLIWVWRKLTFQWVTEDVNLIFVLKMIGKDGLTFCIRMCYAYSNKYKDTKASELYIQNINIKQVITKGFVIKLLLLFINCFCIFMYVWVHV